MKIRQLVTHTAAAAATLPLAHSLAPPLAQRAASGSAAPELLEVGPFTLR